MSGVKEKSGQVVRWEEPQSSAETDRCLRFVVRLAGVLQSCKLWLPWVNSYLWNKCQRAAVRRLVQPADQPKVLGGYSLSHSPQKSTSFPRLLCPMPMVFCPFLSLLHKVSFFFYFCVFWLQSFLGPNMAFGAKSLLTLCWKHCHRAGSKPKKELLCQASSSEFRKLSL